MFCFLEQKGVGWVLNCFQGPSLPLISWDGETFWQRGCGLAVACVPLWLLVFLNSVA